MDRQCRRSKAFNETHIKVETMETLMSLSREHTDIWAMQIGFNEKQCMFEISAEFAQSFSSWIMMCYEFTKAHYNANDWSLFCLKINRPLQLSSKGRGNKTRPLWLAFVCWPAVNSNPKVQIVNNIFLGNLYSIWDLFGASLVHAMYPSFPKVISYLDIMQKFESVLASVCFSAYKESTILLLDVLQTLSNVVVKEKVKEIVVVKTESIDCTRTKSIIKNFFENKTSKMNNFAITDNNLTAVKNVKFLESAQLMISLKAQKYLKLTQKANNGLIALKIVFDSLSHTFDIGNGVVLHELTINLAQRYKLEMPKCKDVFNLFVDENLNFSEFAIFIVKYYTLDYLDLKEKPYWVSVVIGPPVETSKSPAKVAFLKHMCKVYDIVGSQLLVAYDAEKMFPLTFGLKPMLDMKTQVKLGNRTILNSALENMWDVIEKAANEKLNSRFIVTVAKMAEDMTEELVSDGILEAVFGQAYTKV